VGAFREKKMYRKIEGKWFVDENAFMDGAAV
jgi:hypothetical protein